MLSSARATNEEDYLAQKFARVVLGTNNVDCCARVCHAPTAAGMKRTLGTGAPTNSFNDIEAEATIFAWSHRTGGVSGRANDLIIGGDGSGDLADYSARTSPLNIFLRGTLMPDDYSSGSLNGHGGEQGEQDVIGYDVETAAAGSGNDTLYTGAGFVDYVNNTGDSVEWPVDVASAGTYLLEFRYANGSASDRPLDLAINGRVVDPGTAFAPTGSRDLWPSSAWPSSCAAVNGWDRKGGRVVTITPRPCPGH